MKITKTAKLKITSHTNMFNYTLDVYNKALSFYIDVCDKEYHVLLEYKSAINKQQYIKSITHKTNKNKNIKYDFSKDFHKFPSYLRRAVISEAIGVVSSHYSRQKLYLEEKKSNISKGKKFHKKPPTLNKNPKSFPAFYKDNMFIKNDTEGNAKIKLYVNNDWIWLDIKYKANELLSGKIFRFSGYKEFNPTLVKKGKKYFLHIPFQTEVKLNSTPLKEQKIIGVDLGLTNSAVCSCINSSGTVIDRIFINQSIEKDRLNTQLNKLAKAKRKSGIINEKPNYWRKINNLQKYIIQNTVDQVVEFAEKHNADVIVFEYLGKMKVPKGMYGARRLRFKLQYWSKLKIQQKIIEKAWSKGIRYSKVLANGTSKYAYDGSGELKRNNKKDIATFSNGKQYHADLSASYNIAARYFIRAIIKPLSETKRLSLEAKVPLMTDRTNHTLSTLIRMSEVINNVNNTSTSRIQDKEALTIAEISA